MSAKHTADAASGESASDVSGQVVAEYASWGLVVESNRQQPWPTLVLGNEERELHLVLDQDLLEELLAGLVDQMHDNGGGERGDIVNGERRPLPRRLGSKAASASGWPAASHWWRSAESNTRIVVAGIIAAVMVLGLLVTF
ncbi:hypothetical protein ABZ502_16855 [Streptomyces abikoensis]|uniref:hypothetical protein n=1 Tax=Streptomyces abikoensis TaxID=97398 RepID=UPI00340D3C64